MRRKVFARLSTITHDMEMHALKNEVESTGKQQQQQERNPNEAEDDNDDKKQKEEK